MTDIEILQNELHELVVQHMDCEINRVKVLAYIEQLMETVDYESWKTGFKEGWRECYTEGRDKGWNKGYDDALEANNLKLPF